MNKFYLGLILIVFIVLIVLYNRENTKEFFNCPNKLIEKKGKLFLFKGKKIVRRFNNMDEYIKYYNFYASNYSMKGEKCGPLNVSKDYKLFNSISDNAYSGNWFKSTNSKIQLNIKDK